MKRTAIMMAVLGVCAWSFGQSNDKAAQNPPASQAAGQAAAAPQGKRPPQAKTQDEFAAYKAALALTDPAAEEKAADDFSAKYPTSELRALLYSSTMQKYQSANNADKMLEMAKKVLDIDPDDPGALIGTAQVLAERTHDTDLDKDQKLAEAKKDAEHALTTIDTDLPSTGYPPEQLNAFKGYLRSESYAILGKLASDASNWPEAEADLRKSIDAFPQQVDSIAVLRLAIALDKQNKTPEALKYANQAVDLTKDQPDSAVAKAAKAEQNRLTMLNSGTAPGQHPAPKN